MAKQSDKTPMTLIACKMLSWPYGTIKSQQMKVQIVIYEKSTKVKILHYVPTPSLGLSSTLR